MENYACGLNLKTRKLFIKDDSTRVKVGEEAICPING